MLKWLLFAAAVVAVGVFIFLQRQAVKVMYVNGLPAYNQLPNQEFIFQRDCYIFKLEDRESSYPLVGAHATVPELPEQVSPEFVGQTINGARILDLVRLGDRVRIVSVRREVSRKEDFVTFELLFTDDEDRRYPRLDAFYILDDPFGGEQRPPRILETYAVRRIKG